MSLDEIKGKLLELNGGLNLLVAQMRSLEGRLNQVESNSVGSVVSASGASDAPLRSPQTEAELGEINSLPDCVKQLQPFEGSAVHYVSWVHSVESILKDYEIVREKPIYRAILQAIRQKIRGSADSALISYNIFDESWKAIKECLSLHYADKRDLSTLEHQLSQLSQRGLKLDEFYAAVNHQLSLIINKIKTESYSEETVKVLAETYRNRALDVFVRGLHGDLSRILVIRRPITLPEAYNTCLEVQNLNYRSNSIHDIMARNSVTAPINQLNLRDRRPPPPPSKRYQKYPNKSHYPPRNEQYFQGSERPPATGPKPAERMDVDRSIQSRQVNYMNRPANNPYRSQQNLHNIVTTNEETQSENFMEKASPAYHI